MSKLLKNTTGSAINIGDTGVSIPASPGSYLIPAQDYPLWTASDDVVIHIGSGDLVANDGNADLDPAAGIALIQGNYVSHTGIRGRDGTLTDVIDDSGTKRFAVDVKFSDSVKSVSTSLSNFTNYIPSGYSSAIPFNTTTFDTTSLNTMHDTTVSESGTATGTQTSTTLQDTTKSWTVNEFVGYTVRLTSGTGANRWRKITSNTSNTLTISPAWSTTPDGTTDYEITELSTRLVAPEDGIYLISGQVGFGKPSSDDTTYGIRFDISGIFNVLQFQSTSSNTEHEIGLSKVVQLSAGDYVEMQAYQGTGAEGIFYASSRTFLSLTKQ